MSSPDGSGGWGSGNGGSGNRGSGGWSSSGWGSADWGSAPYGTDSAGGPSDQPKQTSYQGFGVFESGPQVGQQGQWGQQTPFGPPPRRGRGPLIALVVAVVILLVGGVTTVVVLNLSRPSSQAAPPPSPALNPPATGSSGNGPSSTGEPSDQQSFVAPVVPGWRGISWPAYGIAYDIPPSWQPKPGTDLGVGDDTTPQHVIVSAASLYMAGYCSTSSYRAITGVASSTSQDATSSATQLIDNWANYGFTSPSHVAPQVAKTPPQDVTLTGNRKATLATATITPPPGVPCSAPQEAISVVAVSGSSGTAMLLSLADEGFPGAVSPQDLQRIVTSLRWIQ